jgi:PIN domain nuclease of toxin-antitoxin system
MPDAVTDTHALIWYLADSPRLSLAANEIFAACDKGESVIFVPAICLVEIVYLQEKSRIPRNMMERFNAALKTGTSGLLVASLTADVVEAMGKIPRTIVPEMPDRIIAATAVHLELPLITRDHAIQQADLSIIW